MKNYLIFLFDNDYWIDLFYNFIIYTNLPQAFSPALNPAP